MSPSGTDGGAARTAVGPLGAIATIEALDAPIPMLILEPGMRVRWISSAAVAELGLDASQFVGRSWYELFPEAQEQSPEHQAMFRGECPGLDLPRIGLRLAGREPRYFSLRLRPLGAAGAPVEALLGVGSDITAQVVAEQAMRASEERFRAISTYARDPILICDAAGTLSFASAALERVLGRRPDLHSGASVFDNVHPDDLPRVRAAFERLVADPSIGITELIELRKRRGDGSWVWLEVTASNLLAHPQVRGLVLCARDITRRRQAEAALAASQERLETALWSSKAAYWTIDVASDRAQPSRQFFELTGIDADAWSRESDPWNSRMHPDDRPAARRAYEDYVAGRVDFYECEYRLQTPGGWLWMHDRGRVVERDGQGRALRIAGTSLDATARKSLERALDEAMRTEQRRLRYDLHDGLGQELSGIQFMLAGLVARLRAEGSAQVAELEETLALVRRSIATTRAIAHGIAPASLRRGGLRTALRELARDMSGSRGLRVECVDAEWDGRGLSDSAAEHLYRMAQEALNNARRHGAARSAVVLLRARGRTLELSITDDGRGLPPQREDAQGMGLRIMAYRAQAIGAKLVVRPAAPCGTQVLIHYPLADRDAGLVA